jgi:hypothetical protein
MSKLFDPFDLSRSPLGGRSLPLVDLLGVLAGRNAGPGSVTEYLQRWLQSLSEASRGLGGDGTDGALAQLVKEATASLERTDTRAAAALRQSPLTANLEHLARELASGDWEQTAELIKRIHAARGSGATGEAGAGAVATAAANDSVTVGEKAENGDAPAAVSGYDRARRHLLEHEEEDRRRAWLTDRILDQLRSPTLDDARASNPLQSELRLSCPVQGRASGRFRISNATDRDLGLELRAGPVQGTPTGWVGRLPAHFDPPGGTLRAGEDRVVKVTVDTAGCPLHAGAALELVVDVLGSGQLLHKVWVSIELTGEV